MHQVCGEKSRQFGCCNHCRFSCGIKDIIRILYTVASPFYEIYLSIESFATSPEEPMTATVVEQGGKVIWLAYDLSDGDTDDRIIQGLKKFFLALFIAYKQDCEILIDL